MARLRNEVVAYAKELGFGDEGCEALRLTVSEALTNIVVHAYLNGEPGDMILEARRDEDDQLAVVICDEGSGLVPRPGTSGLGLGLGIMAQMADGFSIANREDSSGTVVSLRFAPRSAQVREPDDVELGHAVSDQ